ncbi:MAG: hypothetical protein QW386_00780 [Candidatus Bathyarchaeia archaeon]
MKPDEAKTLANAANELSKDYMDLARDLKSAVGEVRDAKKLWRQKNNSTLIKIGLALIAFPDPTISDVLGAFFVAAGTVQQGIQRRTIYLEDIGKTFQNTMKEIRNTRETI